MWCISTACLQYAEERLLLVLYSSWRLIELLLFNQICLSPGVKAVLVYYSGVMGYPDWTSSGQHLLFYASKREFCICNKKDSVFLMPFNTHKEERCKLMGL